MLIRPDSPGLKFMLLGNPGDAGFSIDGQLMTSLWLSRFQQARREAETVWWSLDLTAAARGVHGCVGTFYTAGFGPFTLDSVPGRHSGGGRSTSG